MNKFPLIEPFSEKYLKKLFKKLIGSNDMEDALKRLDRLTQEEARMASAQLLEITDAIDSGVRDIAEDMHVIDDRVAGVGDQVQGVDDRVAAVMDGAKYIFYLLSWDCLTIARSSYPTRSRRRKSDGTFVVPELHLC
jgi:hypothetical protein